MLVEIYILNTGGLNLTTLLLSQNRVIDVLQGKLTMLFKSVFFTCATLHSSSFTEPRRYCLDRLCI